MKAIARWLDRHLVTHWREAWRFTSVQLAAVFAAVSAVIVANPGAFIALVGILPAQGPARILMVALIVIGIFIVPVLARLWDQEKRDGKG